MENGLGVNPFGAYKIMINKVPGHSAVQKCTDRVELADVNSTELYCKN